MELLSRPGADREGDPARDGGLSEVEIRPPFLWLSAAALALLGLNLAFSTSREGISWPTWVWFGIVVVDFLLIALRHPAAWRNKD
jgi:hypothetical protein